MRRAAGRVEHFLGPILQASAAAGIAWYLTHNLLGHNQPFFAPIAAVLALSTSHVQRARRTVQMVVGVLLGIGVSELLHPILGGGAISIGAVAMLTLVLAVAVGIGFVGEGMMFVNQAAASAVLVIALQRAGTGTERAVDALVGGAVALVIGVGLFPVEPLRLLWDSEREVLISLQGILARWRGHGQGAGGGGDQDPEAWALVESQLVHGRLAALTQARSTARTTTRVAPRRMSMRARVEDESNRVATMYLLAGAVLDTMRTLVELEARALALPGGLAQPGEIAHPRELALPGGARAQMERLSRALDCLLDAPRPWPAQTMREVAEVLGERHARAGSAQQEAIPGALVSASLARAGADLLRLLPGGASEG